MVEALLGLFTGPSLSRFLFTLHIIACNLLFARHAWRLYLAIWVIFAVPCINRMPDGVIGVGDSGLCCCVPVVWVMLTVRVLFSNSLCLLMLLDGGGVTGWLSG